MFYFALSSLIAQKCCAAPYLIINFVLLFLLGSIFDKFPFLLPCLFNCALLLISIILSYFFLEETLDKRYITKNWVRAYSTCTVFIHF